MQKAPPVGGKEPVARAIGQTFATVQHLADLAFSWGFKALKKVSSSPVNGEPKRKSFFVKAKHAGRTAIHFLGSAGDAYYEWYERLKARRNK